MADILVGHARELTGDEPAGLDAHLRNLKLPAVRKFLRQSADVSKARLAGNYKARNPTTHPALVRLNAEGWRRTGIAQRTRISVATVYRVPADAKRASGDWSVAAV